MAHRPDEELARTLAEAASHVEVGGTYAHYKDLGKTYAVRALAFLEENDEIAVVYQALYGEQFTFVRPLASWRETVSLNGTRLPRFQKVS